ncbi:TIM21-domain-containing protein [Talaromyces proteolyticus]|uniref:Mitochondrial import inner membrane translocase subunit Tim21 n=1 Tax=Talaromyces proteolyticus TaxID=1131652 RepID=A0AAD4KJL8_9EURO|nr:TIM21-domain-containing protein [Talaromyces proteolyticus]KAH8690767.1 TIM21-domain-containing protein [Talaromyces proteolyticus]
MQTLVMHHHTSVRAPRPSSSILRSYATQSSLGGNGASSSSGPTRKQISVMTDDGRYRWGELSGGEKVARATQQSFNFLIVALGVVMTGGVITLLYTDVFSPNSKTWQFEKAVGRIKDDPRCTALLGDSKKIKAYGEATWNKWARNRPIATTVQKDSIGREHMRIHFNVEGPLNRGVVHVHMIKPVDEHQYHYRLLALDVQGHPRIILEQTSDTSLGGKKSPLKILGINWR